MIKVRNFQALIDNDYNSNQLNGKEHSQSQNPDSKISQEFPQFQQEALMLSPSDIDSQRNGPTQPQHVIQAQQLKAAQVANTLAAKNQVDDNSTSQQKLLVISNKSGNNTSGNESSGDSKNNNRFQVSFNEVAPIFKIDKVPSNSNSKGSGKSSGGQSPNQ